MLRAWALLLVGIVGFSCVSIAEESTIAAVESVDDDSSRMEDRKFYLKAMADRGAFKSSKARTGSTPRKYKNHSVANSADFGAGYYFNDEFRGEVLFHQEYNNKFENKLNINTGVRGRTTPAKATAKNNLYALMLGVNMNVVDFEYGKLFVIGNLGVSQVKEKYAALSNDGATSIYDKGKKQNFAYGVGVGADFKLSERLHAEIAYRFNDYGQTKSMLSPAGYQRGKIKLQSHNALVGLRVDM